MEAWLEENNRYLEASLEWLRLRLQRLIPEQPSYTSSSPAQEPFSPSESGRLTRWLGQRPLLPQVKLLPEGRPPSLEERIREAEEKRAAAALMDPPPALVMLANLFGLSSFERDSLLLCAALEFDPTLGSLCAAAQGNAARTHPTFSLALSLFDDPRWDVLSTHTPLRFARLIEINQPGAMPLTTSALRADERVVNFLKGLNLLDDRLANFVSPLSCGDAPLLAASQRVVVDEILRRLRSSDHEPMLPVVQLRGVDEGSKQTVAGLACAALGRQLYRIGVETLPSQVGEIETLARLWQRECFLLPLALYIEVENSDVVSAETSLSLQRLLSRDIGLVFVSVRDSAIRLNRASLALEIEKPTPVEQCEAWANLITGTLAAPQVQETAQILAGQFDFSLSDISETFSIAAKAPDFANEIFQRTWEACRAFTRPRLDSLAQRLEPKAEWADLVLPDEQMMLMHQIAGQVRNRHKVYHDWGFSRAMNRGFGISALFSGESGTGKTMAAEVLANDLQLNLYRIDLSAVVSKYIGETEKNLRRLFDAAERGGAILFFDEADALFGKRSEVKDSHDRYANIEVNYLLQRMEAFRGLAILATNMKSALDPAFMRRLRFVVNLTFPGLKERKLIWEKALPQQTPCRNLDYEHLARLNISGGNIHSIALNAAFIAAQNGQTVTMPILLSAARGEMKKLEKPFSEAEFRSLETAVVQ